MGNENEKRSKLCFDLRLPTGTPLQYCFFSPGTLDVQIR